VNTGRRAQAAWHRAHARAHARAPARGTIEAASEGKDKGCEFVVTLPIAEEKPAAQAADEPACTARLIPGSRVLVVDDNHDAADSLGLLLRFLGADAMVVHDGPAALKAMRTFKPAVVLLDLGMPDMDGLEVARRMRADPEMKGATLVALTGWGQREDRRRTGEAGFDYHLVKPADVGALEAILSAPPGEPGPTRH